MATWKKRLTGGNLDSYRRWQVPGTDLGIPYLLENGSVGFLFGDTFNTSWPEEENNDWVHRSCFVHTFTPPKTVGSCSTPQRG